MKVLEKYVAALVWKVDDKELKQAEKDGKAAGKTLSEGFKAAATAAKTFTKVVGAASAAVSGFLFLTNKHTAIEVNRAKAFGQSAATIDALGYAMANMGIDEERIIDLTKEMNAKMGEFVNLGESSDRMSQAFGQVRDVLTLTGQSIEDVQDLNPADQFTQIAGAMQEMVRAGNLQGAQAAAKILFGEEGTKIIGFLGQYPEKLQDIIDKYKALSLLTDDGRQGAVAFFKAFNEGRAVVTTLGQELAGLTGKALIPLVNEFNEWVITNRKMLQQKITRWALRLARSVERMSRAIGKALSLVIRIAEALYRFRGAIISFAGAFAIFKVGAFLAGLKIAINFVKLIATVKAAGWIAALTGLFLIIEDIHHGITKGRSIFYDLYQVLSWEGNPEWMNVWKDLIDDGERFIENTIKLLNGEGINRRSPLFEILSQLNPLSSGPPPTNPVSRARTAPPSSSQGKRVTSNNSVFNINVTTTNDKVGRDTVRVIRREMEKGARSVFDSNHTGVD